LFAEIVSVNASARNARLLSKSNRSTYTVFVFIFAYEQLNSRAQISGVSAISGEGCFLPVPGAKRDKRPWL